LSPRMMRQQEVQLMADQEKAPADGRDSLPTFFLPEPLPEFVPLPAGERGRQEKSYFDPERWNNEVMRQEELPDCDPVASDFGRLDGSARAAIFFRDFHLADG